MKFPLLFVSLLITSMFVDTCEAQFRPVRNLFQGRSLQVGSACPGGICPTSNVVAPQRGHWDYPGTIDSHLENDHGVSTAGMTRQQKLDLHDSLHEGTAPAVRTNVLPRVRTNYSTNATGTVSYGSTGTKSGGSSGTVTYGSTGSAVATTNTFSLPVQVVVQVVPAPPAPVAPPVVAVPAPVPTAAAVVSAPVETSARSAFRTNLVKAIQESRKSGKINGITAIKLRAATLSPAFMEAAHDLAVTQIAFSSETSTAVPVDADGKIQVEGINWDGLGKFLEVFVPLLITLLKAFGLSS